MTNDEIVEAMAQFEDRIEASFTALIKALEMMGQMFEELAKQVSEVQAAVDDLDHRYVQIEEILRELREVDGD